LTAAVLLARLARPLSFAGWPPDSTAASELGGRLRLFYLPPYSPDRNPDELVWKHLKADTVGRTTITSFNDFKNKVKSSMISLQRSPEKIRSFFQKPSLKYAA
jgi:transposase